MDRDAVITVKRFNYNCPVICRLFRGVNVDLTRLRLCVFFIPLKNAYLDPPTGRIESLALDCPVGSPCLSVGKRDKITAEWCSALASFFASAGTNTETLTEMAKQMLTEGN